MVPVLHTETHGDDHAARGGDSAEFPMNSLIKALIPFATTELDKREGLTAPAIG